MTGAAQYMGHGLVLDIFFAAAVAAGAFIGAKRGFARGVIGLAFLAAAVFGSEMIAEHGAEPLYMRFIRERVVDSAEGMIDEKEEELKKLISDKLSEKLGSDSAVSFVAVMERAQSEGFGEWLDEHLTDSEYGDKIYNEISELIKKKFRETGKSGRNAFSLHRLLGDYEGGYRPLISAVIRGNSRAAAEFIEKDIVRPAALRMIRYVLRALSFSLILLIGRIVGYIVSRITDIEIFGRADAALGGITGALAAFGVALAAAFVLRFVIYAFPDGAVTEDMINDTLLFKYIYMLTV